ncbi:MAG TPA: glycosyltransferase family 2 protein [Candidatus Limnocylindrales bacterium]|nr:glycosyltransferase family 2 protein [Candidatus Limnocylindrales bacterium]
MTAAPRIAVFIPCLDEEPTIGKVVDDFRRELPDAAIFVIDNGSTDRTAQVAEEHGAQVVRELRKGKGFAVRTAFRRIDADILIMVDGDDTYPAEAVGALLRPVLEGLADMTVGSRLMHGTSSDFGPLNRLGNWIYPTLLRFLLRTRLTDVLSGFRVMTREFVRGIPIASTGFEIEAELTVKAVERGYRVIELPIDLRSRPEGSHSKIRIFADGWRILWTIILLFRDYRPLSFFGGLGLVLMIVGLIPGIVVLVEFLETGLVPRLPSAVLAAALELAGILLIGIGVILSAVNRRFEELEGRLAMTSSEPDLR